MWLKFVNICLGVLAALLIWINIVGLQYSDEIYKMALQKGKENQIQNSVRIKNESFCPVTSETDSRIDVTTIEVDQAKDTRIGGPNCLEITVDLDHEAEQEYCVPKMLHFVWVGNEIPQKYINNIYTFRENNPEYEITLWTQVISDQIVFNSTDKFFIKNITQEMEDYETKDLIDNEGNMGAKSDILRYNIVYRHGGVYFDTDSISEQPFHQILTHSFVTHINGGYNNISNSVFGFPKGSKFLKYVLELLRWNIKRDPEGYIPFKTGPAFWSGAFLKYNDNNINMISQKNLCLESSSVSIVSQTHDASW